MRATVMRNMKLVVDNIPTPEPGPGEVLVKTLACGICGSDLHILHGSNPFARYPRIIGHEFAGVVESVGIGVEALRPGQRVVVDPVVSCGLSRLLRAFAPSRESIDAIHLERRRRFPA